MNYKDLNIVSVESIPKAEDCPDDLSELFKLGSYMQKVCETNQGIGLSAVQVGVALNFFIIKFDDNYRFFVNCHYEPLSQEKIKGVEGCLSIKGSKGELRLFEVERFKEVRVVGKELLAETGLSMVDIDLSPEGFFQIVFQHEIDHQKGILISDIGKELHIWNK